MSALSSIRVIDMSSGPATGLASMMLADFGAEVIKIDRPDEPYLDLAAAPMWRRNKTSLTLDLNSETDAAVLHRLLPHADILIANQRYPWLEEKALDAASLEQQIPHLIHCHLSGFPRYGKWANYPGYEHIVAAFCGRMMTFRGLTDRTGPVVSALQVGIHATAQALFSGLMAALHQRALTGIAAPVYTSLLQGMLPYEQGAMLAQQFPEQYGHLLPDESQLTLPSLFYHPAQTADGSWLQFGNLLPHLFDNFLVVTDLIELLADPQFDPQQMRLPDDAQEAFRARMLERISAEDADSWMRACVENGGVVAGKYQTSQQAIDDPDIVANGHVQEVTPGHIQLGPIAKLSATPAIQPSPMKPADELIKRWQTSQRPVASVANKIADTRTAGSNGPLAGLKVVEIATIIAAPLGASFLADLGADVIKVEQLGGDPFRGFHLGIGATRVNAGKRSLCLNLKDKAAQQILLTLCGDADIVIHNYRPGVPERLGFDYASVQALNPDVIYLQCNGYGEEGPGAQRPSTHPIPGASMGGVLWQLAGQVPHEPLAMSERVAWCAKLMRANEVNPDPNTGVVVASAALLGLAARSLQGIGQQVKIDMFGANAYANHDDFLRYPGKPERTMADPELQGYAPCYRLYPCQDEQWIFLALVTPRDKTRFIQRLAELAHPANLTDLDSVSALEELFLQRTAEDWEALLAPQGIGCVRADRHRAHDFWLEHPLAVETALTVTTESMRWGNYQRHGVNVTVGTTPKLSTAPEAGEHSALVLEALGFEPADIARLKADNVIG